MHGHFAGKLLRQGSKRFLGHVRRTEGLIQADVSAIAAQQVAGRGYASGTGEAHGNAAKDSVKAAPKSSGAAIGAAGLAAAGIGYWFWSAEKEGQHSKGQGVPTRAPDSRPGVASAPPVPLPDFSLKTHKGDVFSKERLLGDFALLYLGSLANAEHTKSSLERMLHIAQQQDRATNMHMLQPVFLPLDQESASPEKLADFMGYLDKQGQTGLRLLAATGPDVRKVADAALSHSAKAGKQGKTDSDYADTGLIYLIHPDGNIILQFSADTETSSIVDTIAEQAKDYKATHPGWHGPKAVKERRA